MYNNKTLSKDTGFLPVIKFRNNVDNPNHKNKFGGKKLFYMIGSLKYWMGRIPRETVTLLGSVNRTYLFSVTLKHEKETSQKRVSIKGVSPTLEPASTR